MAIPCAKEKKINDKEESINNGDVKKNLFFVLISKNICNNTIKSDIYLRMSIGTQPQIKLTEINSDAATIET